MDEQKKVAVTFMRISKEERVRMASDPDTAPGTLGLLLLNDPDEDVQSAAIRNRMTPLEDLAEWYKRNPLPLGRRYEVANKAISPNTPPEILEKLAKDAPFSVRKAGWDHPYLPREMRCKIAREFSMWQKALYNPYVPQDMKELIQQKLDKGENSISDEEMAEILSAARKYDEHDIGETESKVKELIREGFYTAEEIHSWFGPFDEEYAERYLLLLENPMAPKEILSELAAVKNERILNAVLKHKRTPMLAKMKTAWNLMMLKLMK